MSGGSKKLAKISVPSIHFTLPENCVCESNPSAKIDMHKNKSLTLNTVFSSFFKLKLFIKFNSVEIYISVFIYSLNQ